MVLGGLHRRRQQAPELAGAADVVVGAEAGHGASRPAGLQQGAFEGHRRPRVAQGGLDDQVALGQDGELLAHQTNHLRAGGDEDVGGARHGGDARVRVLQHRRLAGQGLELLRPPLPAVGPQAGADAAGADDELQHTGSATRYRREGSAGRRETWRCRRHQGRIAGPQAHVPEPRRSGDDGDGGEDLRAQEPRTVAEQGQPEGAGLHQDLAARAGRSRRPRLGGLRLEVDHLHRLLQVQLPGLAVEPGAAVVVQAEGEVAGLLHLVDHRPAAEGVDRAGREHHDVGGLHPAVANGLLGAPGGQRLFQAAAVDARAQTEDDPPGVQDVPGLGLAEGAQALAAGVPVVGVDLDRQVLGGVDELDQQGELVAVARAHRRSHEGLSELLRQAGQAPPGQRSRAHDALGPRQGGDLEGLPHRGPRGQVLAEALAEAAAAPDGGAQVWLERKDVGKGSGHRLTRGETYAGPLAVDRRRARRLSGFRGWTILQVPLHPRRPKPRERFRWSTPRAR